MTVTGKKSIINLYIKSMGHKKIIYIIFIYLISLSNTYSIEADIFIQSTVNNASKILSSDSSKLKKMSELRSIAKDSVDIKGIGYYTLGAFRKTLDKKQKIEYLNLFEDYFLKSFASRLAEYTNAEISVNSKEIINQNYTIVRSVLKSTDQRPEVRIDWRVYTKDSNNPLIRDLIKGLFESFV